MSTKQAAKAKRPTNGQELCLDIDIKWQGNPEVPAFHRTATVSFAESELTRYEDLSEALEKELDYAIDAAEAEKKRQEEIAALANVTGLDIAKMYDFYECKTPAELIIELNNHVKLLIPQVPHKQQPTGKAPREG